MRARRWITLGCAVAPFAAGAALAQAPPETVLHSFRGGKTGGYPQAGVVADASGALYGTTPGGGAHELGLVYRLSPPAAGRTTWTLAALHSFACGAGGEFPIAGLFADGRGRLFGTTRDCGAGNGGTVFQLTPPAPGGTGWTLTTLHSFTAYDGHPQAAVTMGANGRLYGVAARGPGSFGSVFSLTPSPVGGKAWHYASLYAFEGGQDGAYPHGTPLVDRSGALYGTTYAGGPSDEGVVWKLTPPAPGSQVWTETVLHAFTGGADGDHPEAGLVADAAGTLYGTTSGSGLGNDLGTAFALTPPTAGGRWQYAVIHVFDRAGGGGFQPWAGLLVDTRGGLDGTATGCGLDGTSGGSGVVFRLTPPATAGAPWTETVLHRFDGGRAGGVPVGGVIEDAAGALYGTTSYGGAANAGTVFRLGR